MIIENFTIDPESLLDSRDSSRVDEEKELKALSKARAIRKRNLGAHDIMRARLLQLKLKMEEFLSSNSNSTKSQFPVFLEYYVDTIYPKRKLFAQDIDVNPISLSQVINNHREPKEEFILRLIIHSEKVFKNVCHFQSNTWLEVFLKDKFMETISSEKKWRKEEGKHVRVFELV
ncbi:MAG: hypothetical protein KGM03_03210 [Cytophagales bacterium]|nr:hypothetical protein [Cytophagales bacterium]